MRVLVLAMAIPLLATVPAAPGGATFRRASAADCARLVGVTLEHVSITSARAVTEGTFTPPVGPALTGLPHFCRVEGVITPTGDSRIRFETWLPLAEWNGKFVGVGNGGWAGSIIHSEMAAPLRRGYASGATDTGHEAVAGVDAAKFLYGHPEKLADFAWRAVHEMTVASKALVRAMYDGAPRWSYWMSCSTGGRQGLMEAQRYPADYDGIVAGAPANNFTHIGAGIVDAILAMQREPGGAIDSTAASVLEGAVVAACDTRDGVADGLLEDPRRCSFDPGTIECRNGASERCLTSAQVRTARRIYEGLRHPRTGALMAAGFPLGTEAGWWRFFGPARPMAIPIADFKWRIMGDSAWDYRRFDWNRPSDLAAFEAADRRDAAMLNAFDPDLRPFRARGGKLIQYHGWSDPVVTAQNSITYRDLILAALVRESGDSVSARREMERFYRLYMVPGLAHCFGGPGPNDFDMLGALEAWVERGVSPDRVIAVHRTNGEKDRSRPLCPYPRMAVYKGSGSTDDEANFACSTGVSR